MPLVVNNWFTNHLLKKHGKNCSIHKKGEANMVILLYLLNTLEKLWISEFSIWIKSKNNWKLLLDKIVTFQNLASKTPKYH